VHKKPDENDKRRFRVLLTSRGLELNKMHQSMHNRLAEHLTKVLSDIEQEMFVTLLDKVIQSLK
jgi:DNA-binding MarR family transcriptional regulator